MSQTFRLLLLMAMWIFWGQTCMKQGRMTLPAEDIYE